MPVQLNIIEETKHWMAVNKPASINVEQLWDYPSMEQMARDYLTLPGRKPPYIGIVHRLDRPVSGVLLLAKKKSTLKALNEQFAQKKVLKKYWAITGAIPSSSTSTIRHFLVKDQLNKKALAYNKAIKKSISAELSYRTCFKNGRYAGLEIQPHSGKFHQIRVQLAAIDCPIVGDDKYGSTVADSPNCIALHARSLQFTDPNTGQLQFIEAAIPERESWQMWP